MAFKRGPRGGYSPAERASLPDSAFLKPETRSWPVSDERHARIALQYMARGFGNRAEYPMLRKRLFARYPHLEAEMSQHAAANPLARRNWARIAIQLGLAALPYVVDAFKKLSAKKLKQYEALVAADDVDGQIAFIRKHAWIAPAVRAALVNDSAAEWVRVHLNESLEHGAGEAALAVTGAAADLSVLAAQAKAGKVMRKNPERHEPGVYVLTERWGALPPGVERTAEFHALLQFFRHPRATRQDLWRQAANMALAAVRPDVSLIYAVDLDGSECELRHDQLRQLAQSGVLPAKSNPAPNSRRGQKEQYAQALGAFLLEWGRVEGLDVEYGPKRQELLDAIKEWTGIQIAERGEADTLSARIAVLQEGVKKLRQRRTKRRPPPSVLKGNETNKQLRQMYRAALVELAREWSLTKLGDVDALHIEEYDIPEFAAYMKAKEFESEPSLPLLLAVMAQMREELRAQRGAAKSNPAPNSRRGQKEQYAQLLDTLVLETDRIQGSNVNYGPDRQEFLAEFNKWVSKEIARLGKANTLSARIALVQEVLERLRQHPTKPNKQYIQMYRAALAELAREWSHTRLGDPNALPVEEYDIPEFEAYTRAQRFESTPSLPLIMTMMDKLREELRAQRGAAKRNRGVSSSAAANVREIEQMLRTAPADWRMQFESGFSKLGRGRGRLTLDNALAVLGITAGGNLSSDTASGRNAIPESVREEAMHGLRLSHANNYGAWDFIGIARAIQLATQPGVPDETKRRMRNYFTRHAKDKGSRRFGDDQNPSRGYMAWLNWGGDAGKRWVG